MNKYEAMVIIKPDLAEPDKQALVTQISEVVTKQSGNIVQSAVWAEKKRFAFPIKKYREGTYFLMSFMSPPDAITKIRHLYHLNENILRFMITKME